MHYLPAVNAFFAKNIVVYSLYDIEKAPLDFFRNSTADANFTLLACMLRFCAPMRLALCYQQRISKKLLFTLGAAVLNSLLLELKISIYD